MSSSSWSTFPIADSNMSLNLHVISSYPFSITLGFLKYSFVFSYSVFPRLLYSATLNIGFEKNSYPLIGEYNSYTYLFILSFFTYVFSSPIPSSFSLASIMYSSFSPIFTIRW